MRPAGLAEVERAKADGRWDAAYDCPATIAVPDDLRAALDARAAREAFFAAARQPQPLRDPLPRPRREAPGDARPRIAKFVAMLAGDERLH